jgi:uncharacterized membrane protein YkoI
MRSDSLVHPRFRFVHLRYAMRHYVTLAVSMFAVVGAANGADHDRVRQAVQEGRILPMRELLLRIQQQNAGEVIEAEVDEEDGIIVYEIKVLTSNGRVVKLLYDARTGEPLKPRDGKR